MHIIWVIVGIIAWFLLVCYMTGLAMFLLGLGMFLETGNWLWVIAIVIGAGIMCRSN